MMSEFAQKLAKKTPDMQRYYLKRLPYSQAEAGKTEKFYKTLTKLDFLEAKVYKLGVQSLISDYDLATNSNLLLSEDQVDTLRLIQGAIRMSANVLTDDPSQLPSQLLGHLISYRSVDESEFETKSLPQILLKKVIVFCKEPPELVETLMLFAREVTFNILVKPLQFIDDKLPSRFSLYPFLGCGINLLKQLLTG